MLRTKGSARKSLAAGSNDRAAEYAWKALGTIRMVNGGLALLAPRWLARRLGVRPEAQPAVLYVLRMFGIRTLLVGADLWLQPDSRRRALEEGVLIHASDTTAALTAALFGHLPLPSALRAASISGLNTALAIFAAGRLRGR